MSWKCASFPISTQTFIPHPLNTFSHFINLHKLLRHSSFQDFFPHFFLFSSFSLNFSWVTFLNHYFFLCFQHKNNLHTLMYVWVNIKVWIFLYFNRWCTLDVHIAINSINNRSTVSMKFCFMLEFFSNLKKKWKKYQLSFSTRSAISLSTSVSQWHPKISLKITLWFSHDVDVHK